MPWLRSDDLPCFFLTHGAGVDNGLLEWSGRDTVRGFGSDTGSVLLAELLLNISGDTSPTAEVDLQGESGFRGVGPLSAEVKLLLPGAADWRNAQE